MAKYGSSSVGFVLVGGYSLLGSKIQSLTESVEAKLADTSGLGDSWGEVTPVGFSEATIAQDGAFFDDGTGNAHEALKTDQATSRVMCVAFAGNTAGQPFVGYAGTYSHKYTVLAKVADLTKADVEYTVSGQRDEGVILQPLAAQTADWNTESTSYDSGASSADGGIAFQQVTALSGFTGYVGKVRDSADDITFADLATFANVTAAPAAEAVTVAGTVDRYLAVDGNVTGTGSITAFLGFARR